MPLNSSQQLDSHSATVLLDMPCILEQVDAGTAQYSYKPEIKLLTITINGFTPIELLMDQTTSAKLIDNKDQTIFSFKEISQIRYGKDQVTKMFQPILLTISNPLLATSITYPQQEITTIVLKPLFKELISNSRTTIQVKKYQTKTRPGSKPVVQNKK